MTDLLMVQARAAVVSSPVIRLQAGHMVASLQRTRSALVKFSVQ